MSTRMILPAAVALSVISRLLWIWAVPSYPTSDGYFYYTSALGIAEGKGYLLNGQPTAYWPVGYPAFLAMGMLAFGKSVLVPKLANVVMFAVTLVLTHKVTRRSFKSERIADITVVLLAVYPNYLFYSGAIWSEPLGLLLVMTGATLLSPVGKRMWFRTAAAGVVFALASLTKPVFAGLAAVFMLATLLDFERQPGWFLRSSARLLLLYLFLIATLLPWAYRNMKVLGRPILISTNGGIVLFIGNNEYANGQYESEGMNHILAGTDIDPGRYATHYILTHPWRTLQLGLKKFYYIYGDDIDGWSASVVSPPRTMNQSMYDVFVSSPSAQEIRPDFPGSYMRSGVDYVLRPDVSDLERTRISSVGDSSGLKLAWLPGWVRQSRWLARIYYVPLMLCAIGGIVVQVRSWLRERRFSRTSGILVIGYITIVHCIVLGASRYRFVEMPWVCMYAAVLADDWISRRKRPAAPLEE